MAILRSAFKMLRLGIIHFGPAWMFTLLTSNFNRTVDSDLGGIAVVITTMIGLHHFLSPFQVFWGRLADQNSLWGYRRTPFILVSSLIGSLIFLFLPPIAIGLGAKTLGSTLLGFGLFTLFGLAMAANGGATNSLVAEVTTEKERPVAVAVVRTLMIMAIIATAGISKQIMPEFDLQKMQDLYNLTPFVVLGSALIGLLGLEKRLSPAEHTALLAQKANETTPENPFRLALQLLKRSQEVRLFFWFVLLAIMGIFFQDAILEPFGKEVFQLKLKETATFTQIWGASVLFAMLLVAGLAAKFSLSKKLLATLGGLGIALGLCCIALAALTFHRGLINPGLILMGLSTGVFNIGALTMMMEMTVEGHTGLYMGLWGMAQGLGNGLANALSGAFKTLLIESGWLPVRPGYGLLFGFEALTMLAAVLVLHNLSLQNFNQTKQQDLSPAMVFEAAG